MSRFTLFTEEDFRKVVAGMKLPAGLPYEKALALAFKGRGMEIPDNKTLGDVNLAHGRTLQATEVKFFGKDSLVADDTNFGQSAVRDKGEHFVITAVRFLEGADATVDATDWTEGASTADVKNGQIAINVNGVTMTQAIKLTNFTEADENPESGFYKLAVPVWVPAQTEWNALATFPTAPATADQNGMVEVYGVGFVS